MNRTAVFSEITYIDIHVPMLERMYQKRLKGYVELGYPKLTHRYAVIDGIIVWYGDVNFLSSAKPENAVIRLESPELAGELLDMEGTQE